MILVEHIAPIAKFKTSMLRSSLCDYSDAYILVIETITIVAKGAEVAARQVDKGIIFGRDKRIIFRNCAPFTDCITEINR